MQNEFHPIPAEKPQTNRLTHVLLLLALMAFAVLIKALPYILQNRGHNINEADVASYLWHFSPLLPLTLVIGSRYPAKTGTALALILWFASDLVFWAVTGRKDWVFYAETPLHYLSVLVVCLIGYAGVKLQSLGQSKQGTTSKSSALNSPTILTNLLSGMIGASVFFLVSNFFVWVGGAYPMTVGGLLECYKLAIPFQHYNFLSMAIYVPVFTVLLCPKSSPETAKEGYSETAIETRQK